MFQLPESSTEDDALLCSAARRGDPDAMERIIHRYSRLVKTCARPFFLQGADSEDLIQEGMIGLLKAIRGFDSAKQVPFEAFARLCIERQVTSAVRSAASRKHEILNHSIPIEKPLFDDDAEPHAQVEKPISDPESLVISMEEQRERMERILGLLSVFEAKVLKLYLDGLSSMEIAGKLDRPFKAVDNAIQRIRRKSAAISL